MDCKLCQQKFGAYRLKDLPDDMKTQVDSHLAGCRKCEAIFRLEILSDRIISIERDEIPGSLSTQRIMENILSETAGEYGQTRARNGIIRPLLIAGSVAAALFAGILTGNLYHPVNIRMSQPEELSMLNDSEMELVINLSNE